MTETTTTRAEHLAWCKQRALEYVDAGDVSNAFASMISDMQKHPQTFGHIGLNLGSAMMFSGNLSSIAEMRHWIEGFN